MLSAVLLRRLPNSGLSEILIYSPELDLIVHDERGPAGASISLPGASVHGAKTIRYGLERVREQFLELGDDADEFLRRLQLTHAKNPGFHARYILHLIDDIIRMISTRRLVMPADITPMIAKP